MNPATTLDLAHAAGEELEALLAGRPLIIVERFTTALRASYTGAWALPVLRPAIAVGCYRAWDPALPGEVIAAEDRTRERSPGARRGWLDLVHAEAAERLAAAGRPGVILAWYGTPQLRAMAGPGGVVAAVDGGLRERIEAKPSFGQLLRAAGVPRAARIPAVRVGGHLPSLAELRRAVGTRRVVVQAGTTSGGHGTVIVTSEADMPRAAALPGPWRVAAFVEGWSANLTVLSVPDDAGGVRVYVDRPSHKAIGVAEAGIRPAASAGNDWSRPWPAPAAALLIDCAERVAAWAWRAHRAAGLFGLDAILTSDGQVRLNEVNFRLQGTTEVAAVNQQRRGVPPFICAHLAVMLGGRAEWLGDPHTFNHATIATATRPGGPFYAKIRLRAPAPPICAPGGAGPGVYRLDTAGRLRWARPGAHPADADTDAGEVLLANLPAAGVVCRPGAELATVEGFTSGAARPFDGPSTLSPQLRRVISAVHGLFTPHSEGTS
jgi:hypothetical protein